MRERVAPGAVDAVACSAVVSAALPFGLGQVLERLEAAVAQALEDSAFYDWLPQSLPPPEPLARSTEALCVALGLWLPCLLAYSVVAHRGRRLALALAVFVVGVGVTALSCALTWGPLHAWVWLGRCRCAWAAGRGAAGAAGAATFGARLRGAAVAGHRGAFEFAQPSAHQPLLCPHLQLWEQGRFCALRSVAMAGLAVALRGAGGCAAAPVAP